ncbi:MAG: tetratricopeptide repeat protein [Phycisphaerae bacterium]|nr:tetratricopeptide repeat protein [Phycisphaerae bacterium]
MAQPETNDPARGGKGEAFFDRADQVAETGNWDFAVQLYLEGLQREPENIARGHQPLRQVSLRRKAEGGKSAGMIEQMKRRPGKGPLENLLNAEYLLAKDPGSAACMERVFKAAVALELKDVALWVADIIIKAQGNVDKPNRRICQELTQALSDLEAYERALRACQLALKAAPDDAKLNEAMRNLSAAYTIQKGKYDQEGDFTRSVKDLDKQKELIQKDALAQSESYLQQQVAQARQQYEAEPSAPGKVNALVDALLKFEDTEHEDEAISVLDKAHQDTGAYQFKFRMGDVRMRQMTRAYRQAVEAGDTETATQRAREQLRFELDEYAERVKNYPTDLALKYELGRRQYLAGQYDDAIATLQQAQRDPRRHLSALNYLGQAFAKQGLLREAAETYQRALQSEMPESRAKELRYNYGNVLFDLQRYEDAREQFSQVAQMDYGYQDIRQRLAETDKKIDAGKGSA